MGTFDTNIHFIVSSAEVYTLHEKITNQLLQRKNRKSTLGKFAIECMNALTPETRKKIEGLTLKIDYYIPSIVFTFTMKGNEHKKDVRKSHFILHPQD